MKCKINKQKIKQKSKKIRSKSGFFCIVETKVNIYKVKLNLYNKCDFVKSYDIKIKNIVNVLI